MEQNTLIKRIFHAVETKAATDGTRQLTVIISTDSPDRSQDIVVPTGCDLTAYKTNPVVAQFHNYHEPAIAKCLDIQVQNNRIVATIEFPPEGDYEDADVLYNLYKGGFMNAWSIGFIPKAYEEIEGSYGYKFTQWELLEFSAVLVPDNAEAITIARSKGLSEAFITKSIEEAEETIKQSKSGRTFSAKNQAQIDLLKEAVKSLSEAHSQMSEHMQKASDALEALCGDEEMAVAEDEVVEKEAETEEVKEVETKEEVKEETIETTPSLLTKLQTSLKTTDKQVGLTLKLIKIIQAQTATKGYHSDGERN